MLWSGWYDGFSAPGDLVERRRLKFDLSDRRDRRALIVPSQSVRAIRDGMGGYHGC
jgi:hypothetical protein